MRLIFLKNVWRKNTHAIYKFRIQIYKITQRGSHWTFLECLTEWRKYLCAVFFGTPFTFPCSFIFTVNKKIFIFFFIEKRSCVQQEYLRRNVALNIQYSEIKFCLVSFKHNTLSIHIYTYMNLYFICGNLQYCHIFFATKNF